jgi:hypothetical protein
MYPLINPKEMTYTLKFTHDGAEKEVNGKAYKKSATDQLYDNLSCSSELPVVVTTMTLSKHGHLIAAGFSGMSITWADDLSEEPAI